MAGIKLAIFGGGVGGERNGSEKSDGKNLVRMRSILSLKKSRNVLARDDASGHFILVILFNLFFLFSKHTSKLH